MSEEFYDVDGDGDGDGPSEFGLVPVRPEVDLSNGGAKPGVLLRYRSVDILKDEPHLRVSILKVGEPVTRVVSGMRSKVEGLALTKTSPKPSDPNHGAVRFHWTLAEVQPT